MQIHVQTPAAELLIDPFRERRKGFVVRRAELADMPELQRMAQAFHAAWRYAERAPIDLDAFASTVANLATNPAGVVLVADNGNGLCGMAAATATRHWFNAKHITGQELFWWADESARGTGAGFALLGGLEDWARSVGCQTFMMVSTVNLAPEKLAKVYKRRGYVPCDIQYLRSL